jgi:hypothetical protein
LVCHSGATPARSRVHCNYQNDGAESATTDRFSYVVKTSGDQVSSPAEVRIFVEEPPPKMQVPGQIEFDEIAAGERDPAADNYE